MLQAVVSNFNESSLTGKKKAEKNKTKQQKKSIEHAHALLWLFIHSFYLSTWSVIFIFFLRAVSTRARRSSHIQCVMIATWVQSCFDCYVFVVGRKYCTSIGQLYWQELNLYNLSSYIYLSHISCRNHREGHIPESLLAQWNLPSEHGCQQDCCEWTRNGCLSWSMQDHVSKVRCMHVNLIEEDKVMLHIASFSNLMHCASVTHAWIYVLSHGCTHTCTSKSQLVSLASPDSCWRLCETRPIIADIFLSSEAAYGTPFVSKPFDAYRQTIQSVLQNYSMRVAKPFDPCYKTIRCMLPNHSIHVANPFDACCQTIRSALQNHSMRVAKPFDPCCKTIRTVFPNHLILN